ncbi:MAG TPA: hypothetical protein VFH88_00440 [Candidatus Krumholzibacteria bacterium]|nr:hypothetical protein [Candidatus Krumholzibacteria bacterium]
MRALNLWRRVAVAGIVTATLAGCAKTSLTNLWRADDGAAPLGNLLVISLERDNDVRTLWEDAIAAEFQANGVMARPSHTLFPTAPPDTQQVVTVAHRDRYDGVVVTHRLAVTETGRFDNSYSKTAPSGAGEYWRGWYFTNYMLATEFVATNYDDKASYQIDLANATGGGTLMWTGSTTPIKPTDPRKLQQEVCGELVSELMRRGFVAKR